MGDFLQLPFPYQQGVVLETIGLLHPSDPKEVPPKIRKYAMSKAKHWYVTQQALETILVYPYRANHSKSLAEKYLVHDHPMVRRAACAVLVRSPAEHARDRLSRLIYHADPGVSRVALYFLRYTRDKGFAEAELARMKKARMNDYVFQKSLPSLYALAATEDSGVAKETLDYLAGLPKSKSVRINEQRQKLHDLLRVPSTKQALAQRSDG